MWYPTVHIIRPTYLLRGPLHLLMVLVYELCTCTCTCILIQWCTHLCAHIMWTVEVMYNYVWFCCAEAGIIHFIGGPWLVLEECKHCMYLFPIPRCGEGRLNHIIHDHFWSLGVYKPLVHAYVCTHLWWSHSTGHTTVVFIPHWTHTEQIWFW